MRPLAAQVAILQNGLDAMRTAGGASLAPVSPAAALWRLVLCAAAIAARAAAAAIGVLSEPSRDLDPDVDHDACLILVRNPQYPSLHPDNSADEPPPRCKLRLRLGIVTRYSNMLDIFIYVQRCDRRPGNAVRGGCAAGRPQRPPQCSGGPARHRAHARAGGARRGGGSGHRCQHGRWACSDGQSVRRGAASCARVAE